MNILNFLNNAKINSCGISECGAEWRWDTGKSGFRDFDLWLVVRGKGRIIAGEKTVEVFDGSCLLLLPNTHYIGEHDPAHPFTIINVHFSAPENELTSFFEDQRALIYKETDDLPYLCGALQRVVRLYNSDKAELAETVFRSALTEYFSCGALQSEGFFGADKSSLVKKMCDAANLSPESVPPLSSFAAQFRYSADYLGRLFTRDVGISFSEYVANARVNKAKLLLRSSSLSLEEIAEQLRYYDMCHFSRQFKRITGISPGRYRKEAVQNNK